MSPFIRSPAPMSPSRIFSFAPKTRVAASAVIPVVMMKLRRLIMWPPLSKEPIMVSSFGGSPRRIVAARGEQLTRQAPGIAREFFLGPDLSKYWEHGCYGWGTPSLARKLFELKGLHVKYSGTRTYLGGLAAH